MKKIKVKRKLRPLTIFKGHLFTSAVILVGGSSTRYGGNTPKQFLMLEGKPVVAHSLLAFENSKYIDEIILVCRNGDEEYYKQLGNDYAISKLSKVVTGGATRQESALNGLNATAKKCRYLLIHDGARPLVTDDTIRDVTLAAHEFRAACAAMPAKDTIKVADEKGFIARTENRDFVHLAATPQGFYKTLYEACAYSALKEGVSVTDDASILEHYYYPVKLIDCGSENIKITTPSDLVMAEAILKKRRQTQN